MRDGVRLAVTVFSMPSDTARRPAILLFTPYHRAALARKPGDPSAGGPSPDIGSMVRAGFVYVTVDVRGTGASFGVQRSLFSSDELKDGDEIIRWVVAQPWSNGKVGLQGISYNGTAAELILAGGNPAIKAVMAEFTLYDAYAQIIRPGGLLSERFLRTWGGYTRDLNRNTPERSMGARYSERFAGVLPVEGDTVALAQAVAGHDGNVDVYEAAIAAPYKDDEAPVFSAARMSPYSHRRAIRATNVPIYGISGWFDGAYAYGAILRFLNTPNPGSKLVLGPWDHGGAQNISPCAGDRRAGRFDLRAESLRFFDHELNDKPNGFEKQAPVRYYVMCAEQWREARSWPPRSTTLSLYLAPSNGLSGRRPVEKQGGDDFTVALDASSGTASRWVSYVNTGGVAIGYGDRRSQEGKVIAYQSPPLTAGVEVTGHPLVTLHMASDRPAGQLFVYLEDVAPDGSVTYVTEGGLDLAHRRLSRKPAPYRSLTPYRSFARGDARPMTPGLPEEIRLDLWPTAYLFRSGHRIRVSIAGADADNFTPIPAPAPTYRLMRQRHAASRIDLPVVGDFSAAATLQDHK
ncbi:CocE/NonD family hydrolase [Rhizorhabdus wittichii]|uniref:CocE/NonD family hydrolase n=1 Tax=Rhizorhabdus wittichii TaxID=160791 RepID=A0A975D0W6_9SPHN|nr:CocE/NonD family hydrolase [Rhizorhabdus wittichii]QTH20201.1 CocE/NonD family hydrolase [Rhizorhabdus wittichii]